MLNTIYVLKYEKISNSLDRKVDHYLQTFKKKGHVFLFPYKMFDYIGLLKQVLKIQSFYGIKNN